MAKTDPATAKSVRNQTIRWVVTIFLVTMLVSGAIKLASDQIMSATGIAAAFLILFVIVLVGILFDIIGVAVTSADEKPFHSMASRKVPGAQEAIRLMRNAERVSSICNDVIGDICGVVSGSAAAMIAARVLLNFDSQWHQLITLSMSALVAGLTVGGKAIGKTFAIESSTKIVYTTGRIIYSMRHFPLSRKKKK